MSFTSQFLDSEEKRKKKNRTGDSFTDEFLDHEEEREEKRQQKISEESSPITYTPKATKDLPELDIAPVDDRKWFQKGAFEDGYQFGDITKTILGTDKDFITNATAGGLGMGEKLVDFFAMVGNAMAQSQLQQGMNDELMYQGLKQLVGKETESATSTIARWQGYGEEVEKGATDFVSKDLYDEKEVAKAITTYTDPMSIPRHILDVDEETDSVLGEKSDALAQSAGQLAAQIGLQAVGVPWWLTSVTTAFGGQAESALQEGASYGEAFAVASISAGAEVLTEKIAGVSFGGKTIGDALASQLSKGISSKFWQAAVKLGVDTLGEGFEEALTEDITTFGEWLVYQDEDTLIELMTSEEAMEARIEAFIGGMALGGGANVTSAISAKVKGVDPVTGLTELEDLVVDKVVEERVAEKEKNGEKLTQREKSNIREAVIGELEKGYISTDTIEKTLGGEEYKAYQDTVNNEDALKKELEELGNKQNPTLADQGRYHELMTQVENIENNSTRDDLKAKLDEKMKKIVEKSSRLTESYNEKARRSQAFEADLTKYDKKQAAEVQKAIDSGILNNTNRTHEFVDMLSKISADKGVLFDFTNNEKLKESGFAVEKGVTRNGFVTKDGVTINVQSAKALNTVVGHEITHVLEGTDLYDTLQQTIFDYAKSKGEYDSRLASITALYKKYAPDADPKAELTADLVGDYLFTDADFINSLSTKHRNVFEKIYDEIKYLYKMATAGSKEARELEKVKRAFEKAYKESGTVEGTKYSLSEYTAEEKKAHNKAVVDHFGKTYSWAETGYLLLDGTRLDLSGKHDGAPGGYRTVDHRDITEALGYDYGGGDYSGSLVQFMSEGNIRIIPECNGINLSVKPTEAQERALANYISKYRGEVLLDIDDLNGNTVVSVEYPYGTNYTKVLNDIREWFDNGKKPENAGSYSLTKEGEAPKRYGNYNVRGEDVALAPVNETTSSKMEQVDNLVDEAVTHEPSAAPLADIAKQARREELQGAYNHNGKQYISDGSFIAELNTVDESLEQSESFPIKRVTKELDEAFDRQSGGNYALDTAGITDGYIKVGNSLFDVKRINAVTSAIENPEFTLSNVRGGDNALLVKGDNGRAVLMPVRAGENANVVYEAQEIDSEVYPEGFEPAENAYTVERELESVREEMKAVYEEYNALKDAGKDAEAQPLFDKFMELNERGQELYNKAEAYKAEEQSYLDSLTDADAPPEGDAPYNMPRGNITLDGKTVKKVTKQVNDMLGLNAEDSAKMAETIQRYAQGEIAEDELFDEIKKNFEYGEEFSNNTEELTSAKKHMHKTRIYVPAELKADFNGQRKDGYGQFRKEHLGHFILVNDKARGLGIDEFYQELSGQYPDLFPDDIWNAADQLKQMGEVATAEPTIDYGYMPYDDGTIQEVCDIINSGIREYSESETLKQLDIDREKFYESADVKEDIAPTFNTARKEQIKGQQTVFEDAQSAPEDIAPTAEPKAEEPKVAKVLESTPKKPKKSNLWQKIRSLLFDKQSSIEDISLKTKNRELMAKADFMLRSESRAQRHIKDKLTPILEKVEATGERKGYEEYIYHLHNVDRMSLEGKAATTIEALKDKFANLTEKQIKAIAAKKITEKTTEKTANTIREAKEYLNALETKNKPVFADEVTADVSREAIKNFEASHADAKAISEEIIEYNKELRQMLVDAGIISQETADLWGEMYPHYVPIKRAGKDGAAVTVPLDSRKTGVNAPIKRATGGNSDMESLLDVMGSRTEQVYRAIARNSFGLELMHTLNTITDTQPASVDEVLDTFDNNYDELLTEGKNGANPTFTVFEDGKRVTFDITEELYDALKPTNDVFKTDIPILNVLTTIQRGLLTQYNPTFIATNAIKDIQDVLINSQHPAKTYANIPAAAKELFNAARGNEGKWIAEYMKNGGEDLTYFDSKEQVFKKEDSKVKKVLGFVPNKIAQANDFVEKLPRLAEYIASRKAGASIEVAMLDAARVTTNFAAGGDFTKWVNKNGFTFLNASVQGFNQQVRNIREAKVNGLKGTMQLAAKVAIAGLPIMLFNALRWDDDEDYEELSDYVKDNYYIVAKYGDGKFVRIPKGRAVSVIQSAFEQMKNLITGNDEVDMERFGQLLVSNLAPNDPLENNILAPIADVIDNKTWYGEELVPTRLQDMPAAEQYDETTDSISKWLGEKLNVSPYKVNYLLDQYSGGIGDSILPMLTPESDGSGIVAPFIDKFTTDSVMKNQNISDFYDKVDELTKNANSIHATDDDILKSKYMNSVSAELGELYTQKREIQNNIVPEGEQYDDIRKLYKDKKIPDKVKDELVRDIQKQIDALAKESLSAHSYIEYQSALGGRYAVVGDRYYEWYEPKEGDAYWRKLDDDQVVKYNLTKNAGNAHYVTDGNVHYRLDEEGEWTKISDKQLERQNEVTKALGITPEEYWSKTDISFMPLSNGEYEYAYDNPENYAVAKAVGGYDAYRGYSNDLYNIKADKDANGKSINGSRKEKVLEYINNLDADYGEKIILFKSEYPADDTYNYEIIEYLNSREDISYEDMETILKELGFTVDSNGNIYWD